MNYLNTQSMGLPFLTLVGSLGGFPEAPESFKLMAKQRWFQFALLYILSYQGGAGQDPTKAAVSAGIFLIALQMLKAKEREGYYIN